MFKNCVLKPNVDTLKWLKASLIRGVKTFAQTMLGFVTVGLAFSDINWGLAFSVSCVAFLSSILTSISGIPEVKGE